jgi:3-hydroxyacyl-[acyl-carrier-protein] dehydratase
MGRYAAPLVGIDQVIALDDTRIYTRKAVTGNEPFFQGHYPFFAIFPGVFTLEVVHQAVCHYVQHSTRGAKWPRLVQIRSVRFLSPLRPGDRMDVECAIKPENDGQHLRVEAKCTKEGQTVVAQAKLRYGLEEEKLAVDS